jgi:hypothetical protein
LVRLSIWLILSVSRLEPPASSMPSVSVTTAARAVKPARTLSSPPPVMNRSVGPCRNWMRQRGAAARAAPLLGQQVLEVGLASIAGSTSCFHLSLAISSVGAA